MTMAGGRHVLVGVVIVVVVAAVIGGAVMLGPPSQERARRLDQRRVIDLRGIERAVLFYHGKNERMPVSVDELSKEQGVSISNDPVTGASYGYRVIDGGRFEICAVFDRTSGGEAVLGVDEWRHGAGRHCFERKVPRK